MATLLEIENLHTQFFTSAGTVRAVDGISYSVDAGETVAIAVSTVLRRRVERLERAVTVLATQLRQTLGDGEASQELDDLVRAAEGDPPTSTGR